MPEFEKDPMGFKMKGSMFYGHGNASPAKKKPEGYYEVKDVSNNLTETGQGEDVTEKYRKEGNKNTRKHIKKGGKVRKRADGTLVLAVQ
tara:strand:- start:6 stop:272 length:267 start_codon:yes stop_codon:yes gene_type:complete